MVTRGEQSMMREATTGEAGVRLPNGEVMTPEKFMARTKMMNQCRESLQVSEKRARHFAEENTRLKQERDSVYTSMRKYEDMLHGFERARPFDKFTNELHRETLEANHRLTDQVQLLSRSEVELKEENKVLRRRLRVMMEEERKRKMDSRSASGDSRPASGHNTPSVAEAGEAPRKRRQQTGRRRIGSDDEGGEEDDHDGEK